MMWLRRVAAVAGTNISPFCLSLKGEELGRGGCSLASEVGMELLHPLDCFLLFGGINGFGGLEMAGMLATSWDSWLFRSLPGSVGQSGFRKVWA